MKVERQPRPLTDAETRLREPFHAARYIETGPTTPASLYGQMAKNLEKTRNPLYGAAVQLLRRYQKVALIDAILKEEEGLPEDTDTYDGAYAAFTQTKKYDPNSIIGWADEIAESVRNSAQLPSHELEPAETITIDEEYHDLDAKRSLALAMLGATQDPDAETITTIATLGTEEKIKIFETKRSGELRIGLQWPEVVTTATS